MPVVITRHYLYIFLTQEAEGIYPDRRIHRHTHIFFYPTGHLNLSLILGLRVNKLNSFNFSHIYPGKPDRCSDLNAVYKIIDKINLITGGPGLKPSDGEDKNSQYYYAYKN